MNNEKNIKRANIGCGQTPTPGWLNFDNSLSIALARLPLAVKVLSKLNLIGKDQKEYIHFLQHNNIIWADVTKHIPLPDDSMEIIYTSHMLEHLDCEEASRFLQEAYRILQPKGIIRIAVPDLARLVSQYGANGDADWFIDKTYLACPRPKMLIDKIKYLIVGARHHHWMYDGASLCRLLTLYKFNNPTILQPGLTTIPDPEGLNLYERAEESIYVEASK